MIRIIFSEIHTDFTDVWIDEGNFGDEKKTKKEKEEGRRKRRRKSIAKTSHITMKGWFKSADETIVKHKF